jgi:hypothetical protein
VFGKASKSRVQCPQKSPDSKELIVGKARISLDVESIIRISIRPKIRIHSG